MIKDEFSNIPDRKLRYYLRHRQEIREGKRRNAKGFANIYRLKTKEEIRQSLDNLMLQSSSKTK